MNMSYVPSLTASWIWIGVKAFQVIARCHAYLDLSMIMIQSNLLPSSDFFLITLYGYMTTWTEQCYVLASVKHLTTDRETFVLRNKMIPAFPDRDSGTFSRHIWDLDVDNYVAFPSDIIPPWQVKKSNPQNSVTVWWSYGLLLANAATVSLMPHCKWVAVCYSAVALKHGQCAPDTNNVWPDIEGLVHDCNSLAMGLLQSDISHRYSALLSYKQYCIFWIVSQREPIACNYHWYTSTQHTCG